MIAKWVVAWKESFSSVKRDKYLRRKERRRGGERRKSDFQAFPAFSTISAFRQWTN